MDILSLQRTHATKKTSNNGKNQLLLNNLVLYSTAVCTSILFCSSPLWFPSVRLFLSVSFPRITSFFLSSKFLFLVGNLIIIVLVGESKFFASSPPPASDVYYDEYINGKRSLQRSSVAEEKRKEIKIEKNKSYVGGGYCEEREGVQKGREDSHGDDENSLPTEELKKRADDFIARVNRQMKLEARLMLCYSN